MRFVFAVLLISVASSVDAQKVYRCTDDRGTVVFSQRPCNDDASKVQEVDTSRALKTGSGGSVAEQGEFAEMNEVRRRCNRDAEAVASRYAAERSRIEREISRLESEASRANNNLAGATWEQALRQQIAGLIAERGSLASAEATEKAAARERCDAEIKATEERIQNAREARSAKDQSPDPADPKQQ